MYHYFCKIILKNYHATFQIFVQFSDEIRICENVKLVQVEGRSYVNILSKQAQKSTIIIVFFQFKTLFDIYYPNKKKFFAIFLSSAYIQ